MFKFLLAKAQSIKLNIISRSFAFYLFELVTNIDKKTNSSKNIDLNVITRLHFCILKIFHVQLSNFACCHLFFLIQQDIIVSPFFCCILWKYFKEKRKKRKFVLSFLCHLINTQKKCLDNHHWKPSLINVLFCMKDKIKLWAITLLLSFFIWFS